MTRSVVSLAFSILVALPLTTQPAAADTTVTWTLSGRITLTGAGFEGVWITGLPGGIVTTSDGSYDSSVPDGWTGTIEPRLPGYRFEPESVAVTATGDAVHDFVAFERPPGWARIWLRRPEDTLHTPSNQARDGDVVVLLPGVFTDHWLGSFDQDGITLLGRGGPGQVRFLPDTSRSQINPRFFIVHGVTFEPSSGQPALYVAADDLWMRNCYFFGAGEEYGIRISSSRNVLIEGGEWTGSDFGLIASSTADTITGEIVLRNGRFSNLLRNGIAISNQTDLGVVLENMVFRDQAYEAVELGNLRSLSVRNVIFDGNGEGLDLDSLSCPVEVAHSVFAGNTNAARFGPDIDVEMHDVLFYENVERGVYGTSTATVVHIDHAMYLGPWLRSGPTYVLDPPTIHNDDPLFTDPAHGDFTLLPSSPARGLGRDGADLGAHGGPLGDAWDPLPSISEPALERAVLLNGPRHLAPGDDHIYTLEGHYDLGFTGDLRMLAQWSSSDEAVLRSIGIGEFEAVADGMAEVVASFEGTTARLEVTVSSSAPPLTPFGEAPEAGDAGAASEPAGAEDGALPTPEPAPALAEATGWTVADSLIRARSYSTSALLPDGRVLVAGGLSGDILAECEIFDPATGRWSAAAAMHQDRRSHTLTLLPDGRVLAVGGLGRDGTGAIVPLASAELYDPKLDTWIQLSDASEARSDHSATLLLDGRVLIVGGADSTNSTAEVYDPALDPALDPSLDPALVPWFSTGSLQGPRTDNTATLLLDGRVLVTGSHEADLFDPATFLWSLAATPPRRADLATATLLPDGRVLVAGGYEVTDPSTHLYDPVDDSWTYAGDLGVGRARHMAALLPDGRVLVVGGTGEPADPLETELFDPAQLAQPGTPTWSDAGTLSTTRERFTMTLLASGQALTIGGETLLGVTARCELFQPDAGAVTAAAPLAEPRYEAAVAPLADGRILVAGGRHSGSVASVEIYDPAVDAWANAAPLATAGGQRSAVLLPDGRVLVVDPWNAERYDPSADAWSLTGPRAFPGHRATLALLSSGEVLAVSRGGAEVYDPAADTWTAAGTMSTPRYDATLTPLPSGEVLAAGGHDAAAPPGNPTAGVLSTAEIYDPRTRTWRDAARLHRARQRHAAVALVSGEVLVVGGDDAEVPIASAEIYDPATDSWRLTGDSMANARTYLTATLMSTGQVLVAGGGADLDRDTPQPYASTEIYDPAAGYWRPGPPMTTARERHAAALLPSGEVLLIGGRDADQRALGLTERLAPRAWTAARRPTITGGSSEIRYGVPLLIEGVDLAGGPEGLGGGTTQGAVHHPVVQLQAMASGRTTSLSAAMDPTVGSPRPSYDGTTQNLIVDTLPPDLDPGLYRLSVFRAGVPSAPRILPLACSVAVTRQPASQVAELEQSATFSVEAAGARYYQWRRNGVAIAGATGSSYTTPPIAGEDSGAVYDVRVASGCAEVVSDPATLTVADDDPPTAGIVAPQEGEFWLLPPDPDQPPRLETVVWEADDNVRVCRIQVALQFFAEDDWEDAPQGEDLPADFETAPCLPPGETTRSLVYELPLEPPSGSTGSSYRIELRVTDHAGLETLVHSGEFNIVKPDPNAVMTLIVTHHSRMQSLLGLPAEEVDELREALRELATHPRVQGLLVDVGCGEGCDLEQLYEAWDSCDGTGCQFNRLANEVLFGNSSYRGIHHTLRNFLADFTAVENLVLVGDDRVIPMARLQDGATLHPEELYVNPLGGEEPALDSEEPLSVTRALVDGLYLSDDPLAIRDQVLAPSLDVSLFLPDLAVGRLVETPNEILSVIDAFLRQDGVLRLEEAPSEHKVLVTGYDFLKDSATLVRSRWQEALGVPVGTTSSPVDGHLIGDHWNETHLAEHLCGTVHQGEPYSILSLNDHARHYNEGYPSGDPHVIEGLEAATLRDALACDGQPLDLTGRVVYSVGCHGGLPVPGDDPDDANNSLDMAQTLLERGVVAYVANSGFGWGLDRGVGYSERLVEIFTEELTRGGTVSVGRTVAAAKLRYFLEVPYFDHYDQKTLMQWTLFGLPMYAVDTGVPTGGGEPLPPLPELHAGPGSGPGELTVQRSDLGELGELPGTPEHMIVTRVGIDLTAPGLYERRNSLGELEPGPGCDDDEGCYYALNGLAAARGSGTGDLPFLPYLVYDSRLSGASQHGVLWLGGRYVPESGWKPLIGTLTSNGGNGSSHTPSPEHVVIPPVDIGWSRSEHLGHACRPSDLDVNSLVVVAGEVLDTPEPPLHDVHRRYEEIALEVFYLGVDAERQCDREGPEFLDGPFSGLFHRVDGPRVEWAVPVVDDESDVWRVVVVYDTGEDVWQSLELGEDGAASLWRGTVDLPTATDLRYVIQAVDDRGNVSWRSGLEPAGATNIELVLPEVTAAVIAPEDTDLSLQVSGAPDPVAASEPLEVRVEVENHGPVIAAALSLEVQIPSGAQALRWLSNGGWTCPSPQPPLPAEITCTRGLLEVAARSLLVFELDAPGSAGLMSLSAGVEARNADPNLTNNHASDTVLVVVPDLADVEVTIDNGTGYLSPDDGTAYTVTVTNHGPETVSQVFLILELSQELEDPHVVSLPAGTAYDGQVWSGLDLDAGQQAALVLAVTVATEAAGELEARAEVRAPAGLTDPDESNNSSWDVDPVVLPPEVSSLRTVASIDPGQESLGGGTRAGVTQLLLGFSEPVEGADDPAVYRLRAAGPDSRLQTEPCAPAAGDDRLVPVTTEMLPAEPTVALRFVESEVLAPGLYRLEVCGGIASPLGPPLAGVPWSEELTLLGQHLLASTNFDDGTAGWSVEAPTEVSLTGSSHDASAAATSGSVELASSGTVEAAILSQCVSLEDRVPYRFGGQVWLESAVGDGPEVYGWVELFESSTCAGEPAADVLGSAARGTPLAWQPMAESVFLPPPKIQSARWSFVVEAPQAEPYTLRLDELHAATDPANHRVGVFRPDDRLFLTDVDGGGSVTPPDGSCQLGISGDLPLVGDWNGDGDDDFGIYRPGSRLFLLDVNESCSWELGAGGADVAYTFGTSGDQPIIGDWNGDGDDDVGVYRPSTRHFLMDLDESGTLNLATDRIHLFGLVGDVPLIGDWNGDGDDDVGIYRPATRHYLMDLDETGTWSLAHDRGFLFGLSGDQPIVGDWNGDGGDDVGAYRPGARLFLMDLDESGTWSIDDDLWQVYGVIGDQPMVGDW